MYEDIPHLLTPVVVDPKQAANALRWAVREMEERYKTLAAEGVRNIEQYNRNMQQAIAEKRERRRTARSSKPLPFIVVVIDELADLMMVASNEVEESIARLAQMARAVGIHLILATQRPSVDVITGLIKANLPSRISFRVASKIDSRTILDGNGAEQLLGKGDMLFLPPASSRFIRAPRRRTSPSRKARGWPAFCASRASRATTRRSPPRRRRPPTAIEMDKDDLYDEAARIVVHERPGVDLVPAAPAAHRLQPRRAAGRHDGDGRAGLAGRRRQAARSAGRQGYFDEVDAQLGEPGYCHGGRAHTRLIQRGRESGSRRRSPSSASSVRCPVRSGSWRPRRRRR